MAFLKSIWKANGKHKKLSEEQTLQIAKEIENDNDVIESVDNENDVVTFKLKYLGSTVVEKTSPSENRSAEAIKSILKVAKASKKKLQRVNLVISLKGITVTDLQGNEDIMKASIYRISNCATDGTHRQVFSFICTDENETMECHAFLCSKRKVAETVTLAVAQAFSNAYEAWRVLPPAAKEFEKKTLSPVQENNTTNQDSAIQQQTEQFNNLKNQMIQEVVEVKLIDFDDDPILDDFSFEFEKSPCEKTINNSWVCFEDDFVNESQRNGFNLVLA